MSTEAGEGVETLGFTRYDREKERVQVPATERGRVSGCSFLLCGSVKRTYWILEANPLGNMNMKQDWNLLTVETFMNTPRIWSEPPPPEKVDCWSTDVAWYVLKT